MRRDRASVTTAAIRPSRRYVARTGRSDEASRENKDVAAELCAVLLRGVNVGGKNKLPMPALRALLEDAGHEGVATYIQSGNVVFDSSRARGALCARRSRSRSRRTFGLDDARCSLRTHDELVRDRRGATRSSPAEASRRGLHVVFLDARPTRRRSRSSTRSARRGTSSACPAARSTSATRTAPAARS